MQSNLCLSGTEDIISRHFDTKAVLLDYMAMVLLTLCFPLGQLLPISWGWEDGIIENTQAVVLLLEAVLTFIWGRQSLNKGWYAVSGSFLLMMGRELSWGRVFFPTGLMDDEGPAFIDMADVPYHYLIHLLIFLVIVAVAYGLWKYRVFHLLIKERVPLTAALIIVMSVVIERISELHGFAGYTKPQAEVVEELAELVCYVEFWRCTLYYKKFF